MLTVHDMLIDCSIKSVKKLMEDRIYEDKFGQYTFVNGWFLKKKLFGYSSFKATDICWVYLKKTKTSVGIIPIVIPFSTAFNIVCRLSDGREIILSDSEYQKKGTPKKSVDTLQTFQSLIPWAIFGYSLLLDIIWEKSRNVFLDICNRRLTKIKEGLKNNDITIQKDGSLKFSSTFILPAITTDFKTESEEKGFSLTL